MITSQQCHLEGSSATFADHIAINLKSIHPLLHQFIPISELFPLADNNFK